MFPNTHRSVDAEDPRKPETGLRETAWELAEAQYIIQLILNHCGIRIVPTKASESQGWDLLEVTGVWYSPGEKTISIPDIKRRYWNW